MAQCAALGAGWPPSKGWIGRAVLAEHTQDAIDSFVAYASRSKASKAERRARKLALKSVPVLVAEAAPQKTPTKPLVRPSSPEFLQTFAWRKLRMQVLKHYGRRCMCCGATPDTGAVIHVDHIKPRKLFPQLALDFDNLQVLCGDCNHGKGNWDRTDWRPADAILPADQQQHINAILAE